MKASLFAACISAQKSLAFDDMKLSRWQTCDSSWIGINDYSAVENSPPRKLLLSVEVSRHGERATGYIFDFTVDPAQNFKVKR